MKTTSSLTEILELAQSGSLYVRWSRGPAMDKRQGQSRDQVSGGRHAGLSAQRIDPDNATTITAMMLVEYRFLARKDGKIYGWLLTGTRNGTDSDNAPTVDAASVVPVAKLGKGLVAQLTAFSEAFWSHRNSPPKTIQERDAWQDGTPQLSEYVR